MTRGGGNTARYTSVKGRPPLPGDVCRCGAAIPRRAIVCDPCDERAVLTVLALAVFLRRDEPGLADVLVRMVDGHGVLGSYASGAREAA